MKLQDLSTIKFSSDMSNLSLYVLGKAYDSVVDGEGLRETIFVQGCPHHCEGCHNPESWANRNPEAKDEFLVDLYKEATENPLWQGVTFSGGEPFLQAQQFAVLAVNLHASNLDIWCYTGFLLEELLLRSDSDEGVRNLLSQVDVLVDGQFILAQRDLSAHFKGSTNQRVIDMKESISAGCVVLHELNG